MRPRRVRVVMVHLDQLAGFARDQLPVLHAADEAGTCMRTEAVIAQVP